MEVLLQTSLLAAFIAGMVALFAPCCVTFLLPAYLGSVFKEKERVLLMTLVFGAGIFATLLPAVLGVAFISQLLFRGHDAIYLLGGLVMIAVAVISFLGIKLPMPSIPGQGAVKTDVLSIFTLGVFSGITSACCAPVLIGILTLTFLSPSFFGAVLIGAAYVLGMVTPLLLISLFLADRIPSFGWLRRPVAEISLFGHKYPLIRSNMIAGVVFLGAGLVTLYLTWTGQLAGGMSSFTTLIQDTAAEVNRVVAGNAIWDIIWIVAVAYFLYQILRRVGEKR